LKPLTNYTYELTPEFQGSFITPPFVGYTERGTVLSVVGDIGFNSRTFEALGYPYGEHVTHAIVLVGDLAYANGDHSKWDDWFTIATPLLSHIPMAAINGNHEINIASIGKLNENYEAYLNRIITPLRREARAAFRTYYSLDIGLIHCVFLDDYVGARFGTGSREWLNERNLMLQWFEDDLKQVDRTRTPYVLVFKHNPYYSTDKDHRCKCSKKRFEIDDVDACWMGKYDMWYFLQSQTWSTKYEPHCGLQAKLEDVYQKYGVHVVFSGHCHMYERTDFVFKNKIDRKRGTTYITTGAGGGGGHRGVPSSKVPGWSLKSIAGVIGTSKVIATNTSLKIVWLDNNDPSTPLDNFEILLPS
jgi:hypothetical protein